MPPIAPPARPRCAPLTYRPALDGLRALAVVLVLLYHAGFDWLTGGFLGVSVFFTLSGFLITALLLREWSAEDQLDGRRFWARRLRRLTPAAWATVAGVVAFGAVGVWDVEQLRDLRGDVPWAMLELLNWHFIRQGTSYGDGFSAPSPLEHFWSLAVETQFYAVLLVVVMVVLTAGRSTNRDRRLRTLFAVLIAMTALSVVASVVAARSSLDRAYFGTDTRAAEMLFGALLAVVTLRRLRVKAMRTRTTLRVAAVAGLVTIVVLSATVTTGTRWLYPWGLLVTAVASTAVVAGLLQRGGAARLFELSPVVALGRLSYSVYVVHFPVFLWLTPARTGWSQWPLFGLRMAVVAVLSVALHRFVEQPIRHGTRPSARTAAVGVPIIALVLLGASSAVTSGLPARPAYLESRDDGELVLNATAEVAPPTTIDADVDAPLPAVPLPRPPRRVLLIGDSIAASLTPALGDAFAARGIAFASAAVPGCGIVEGLPANGPGDVITTFEGVDLVHCPVTTSRLHTEAISVFAPDLVISLSTWEAIDRTVDGVWYDAGTRSADLMLIEQHRRVSERLRAGGAQFGWVLLPDPAAARNHPGTAPTPEPTEHLRNLVTWSASTMGDRVVDLASIVCPSTPCPSQVDGVAYRPGDGLHFDDPSAAAIVADRFADEVAAIDLNDPPP
ncbi:MAG: acyltransferase [Actinomycetota bacterium]|nr:acyltransferase [Actinomycetota bacterium]